jgi:three-Cys-motif partner protein
VGCEEYDSGAVGDGGDDGVKDPKDESFMGNGFDEIGYWTEIKLDIIREYAAAYSQILTSQNRPSLHHIYIDAFAGSGVHISKKSGDFVLGSPLNALRVMPQFREYHLIDLDGGKAQRLRTLTQGRSGVYVYEGDCNHILLETVFPRALYKDYRRALCLLDPYGLHLNWEVIAAAGQMRTVDVFLNFPVEDMNRNVLWHDPNRVDPKQASRMTAFWGDETWRSVAYDTTSNFFGWPVKSNNDTIAEAFRDRLISAAGFRFVAPPMAMRNKNGATVYYLFFASQKPVAEKIVTEIFNKYQRRGGS